MAYNVNFRQGTYNGFSALTSYEAGTFYVTTDEQGIYLATSDTKAVKLGNIITFATLNDWQSATKPPYSADVFYYIESGNALIKWDGSKFVQLNKSYDGDVAALNKAIQDLTAVVDTKASTEYVNAELAKKADKETTYTKTEVDGLLAPKANSADVYSKTDADAKFYTIENANTLAGRVSAVETGKADKATTLAGYGITDAYTKEEVNTELAKKADVATTLAGYGITDAYTKTKVDELLAAKATVSDLNALTTRVDTLETDKADKATTYTKIEVDGLLAPKANSADVYSKTAADEKFAQKATTLAGYGITDAYTKTEADELLAGKVDNSTHNTFVTTVQNTYETKTDAAQKLADAKAYTDQLRDGAVATNAQNIADEIARAKKAEEDLGKEIDAVELKIDNHITAYDTKMEAVDAKDKAHDDAIAALQKANTDNLDAAKAYSDANLATAKKYTDDEIDKVEGTINTLSQSVDTRFAEAKTAWEKAASDEADAAEQAAKDYADEQIEKALQDADAMTFMGVVGGTGNLAALPAAEATKAGDTYKVGAAGTYAGYTCYVGDLLVAKEDGSADYWHISSGYEDDYNTRLGVEAASNKIVLNSVTGEDHGSVTFTSDFDATKGGIQIVTTGAEDAATHQADSTVSINMVWGSF